MSACYFCDNHLCLAGFCVWLACTAALVVCHGFAANVPLMRLMVCLALPLSLCEGHQAVHHAQQEDGVHC